MRVGLHIYIVKNSQVELLGSFEHQDNQKQIRTYLPIISILYIYGKRSIWNVIGCENTFTVTFTINSKQVKYVLSQGLNRYTHIPQTKQLTNTRKIYGITPIILLREIYITQKPQYQLSLSYETLTR